MEEDTNQLCEVILLVLEYAIVTAQDIESAQVPARLFVHIATGAGARAA